MKAVRQIFRDVLVIEPNIEPDDRGNIVVRYSEDDYNDMKIDGVFVEERVYTAYKKASMFGIYYQDAPYQQNKIIYCERGSAMVYVIDLDPKSTTYKEWICIEIDDIEKKQAYIPAQYGYAFLAMESDTEIVVKTDEYNTDGYFKTITYLDKNIALEFPFQEVISVYKEKQAPTLRD